MNVTKKKQSAEKAVMNRVSGTSLVSGTYLVGVDDEGEAIFLPRNPNPDDVKGLKLFRVRYNHGTCTTDLAS